MSKSVDLIDELYTADRHYCISYLPKQKYSDEFLDFDEYFYAKYIGEIVEKISRIVLTLVNYYKAKIYLTQIPVGRKEADEIRDLVNKNIRGKSLQELHDIIEIVMTRDVSTVQVLIPKVPFMLEIGERGSVNVYVDKKAKGKKLEAVRLLKRLVEREHLYFLRDGGAEMDF